jgi:HSP20 family protein
MARGSVHDWMWSEAVDMLTRADRLHRQFFRPQTGQRAPSWEPPVDVLETDREVVVLAALPGVSLDEVQAAIEDGVLVISGSRGFPKELSAAVIHRLELPQGRFERRVPLPRGRYDKVRRASSNGCLVVSLRKIPSVGGAS